MSAMSRHNLEKINFDIDSYDALFEEYRADLESYIKAFSGKRSKHVDYLKTFLLSKLEQKWLPILNFNSSRIASHITEMQAPKTDIITSLTMRELLSYDDGESEWLIPNFFSSTGLYILAAPPKTGKTILLNMLIYGVAVSGEFLSRPVQTGKVLYIQLEESIKTMKKRARMSGFGDSTDEETSLVINFSDRVRIERVFDLSTDLDWLSKLITEYKPRLVAIDSLRMASVKSDSGENTNEFGKLLYALQKVVNFTGTCCILVHHMNKTTGKNVDLIQRLAGHTSISAASDGIIGLTSEEDESGKMIALRTKPRDGTEMTIYYRLVKNDRGLWGINKIYEDTAANSVFTSKILRFLGNNPDQYYTAKGIARELGLDRMGKEFNEALDYLESSEILKRKYGQESVTYALTTDSLWLVNPQRVKDMVSASVRDANSLMLCTTKRELRNLVQDWDQDREREAKILLFPEERERIKTLIKSWEFDKGDVVMYKGQLYTVASRDESNPPSLTKTKYILENVKHPVLEIDLYQTTKEENDNFDIVEDYSFLESENTETLAEEPFEQDLLQGDMQDSIF